MRKKIIIILSLTILFIVIAILVNELLLKSSLRLTVTSTLDETSQIAVYDNESGDLISEASATPGQEVTLRLKAGTYDIKATQGDNRETLITASLGSFGSKERVLPIQPEKLVQKIGSESLGCDIYIRSILHSYSCSSYSILNKHNDSTTAFLDQTSLIDGAFQQGSVAAIGEEIVSNYDKFGKKGFLAIAPGGIEKEITLPEDRDPDTYVIARGVTGSKFALVSISDKEAFFYQNTTDTNPRLTSISLVNKPGDTSYSFSLIGDVLYTIEGISDLEDDFENNKEGQVNVVTARNLMNDEVVQYDLPSNIRINDGRVIDENNILITNSQSLIVYQINDKLVQKFHTFNASDYVFTAESIYYTRDNGVFVYSIEGNYAQRVFTGDNLRISRLSVSNNQPTFNAFVVNDNSNILHSYTLTNEAIEGRRLEDTLPYTTSDKLPIIKMDYGANFIKTQLSLASFSSDRQTGLLSYDQSEFDANRKLVTDRLTADGIDISRYQLIFVP